MGNSISCMVDAGELRKAIQSHNITKASEMMAHNPSLAKHNFTLRGEKIWHFLAKDGELEMLKSLLQAYSTGIAKRDSLRDPIYKHYHGIERLLNLMNDRGQTPLMMACSSNQAAVATHLLNIGADAWAVDNYGNRLCMHYAAMEGAAEALEAVALTVAALLYPLPDARRVFDQKSSSGLTPLHYAAFYGHDAAMRVLVRLGSDLHARTSVTGNDEIACSSGSTPLHLAAARGHLSACNIILKAYQDQQALVPTGQPSRSDPRLARDCFNDLPFTVAHRHGHYALVELLHPFTPMPVASVEGTLGPPKLVEIASIAVNAMLQDQLKTVQEAIGRAKEQEHRQSDKKRQEGLAATAAVDGNPLSPLPLQPSTHDDKALQQPQSSRGLNNSCPQRNDTISIVCPPPGGAGDAGDGKDVLSSLQAQQSPTESVGGLATSASMEMQVGESLYGSLSDTSAGPSTLASQCPSPLMGPGGVGSAPHTSTHYGHLQSFRRRSRKLSQITTTAALLFLATTAPVAAEAAEEEARYSGAVTAAAAATDFPFAYTPEECGRMEGLGASIGCHCSEGDMGSDAGGVSSTAKAPPTLLLPHSSSGLTFAPLAGRAGDTDHRPLVFPPAEDSAAAPIARYRTGSSDTVGEMKKILSAAFVCDIGALTYSPVGADGRLSSETMTLEQKDESSSCLSSGGSVALASTRSSSSLSSSSVPIQTGAADKVDKAPATGGGGKVSGSSSSRDESSDMEDDDYHESGGLARGGRARRLNHRRLMTQPLSQNGSEGNLGMRGSPSMSRIPHVLSLSDCFALAKQPSPFSLMQDLPPVKESAADGGAPSKEMDDSFAGKEDTVSFASHVHLSPVSLTPPPVSLFPGALPGVTRVAFDPLNMAATPGHVPDFNSGSVNGVSAHLASPPPSAKKDTPNHGSSPAAAAAKSMFSKMTHSLEAAAAVATSMTTKLVSNYSNVPPSPDEPLPSSYRSGLASSGAGLAPIGSGKFEPTTPPKFVSVALEEVESRTQSLITLAPAVRGEQRNQEVDILKKFSGLKLNVASDAGHRATAPGAPVNQRSGVLRTLSCPPNRLDSLQNEDVEVPTDGSGNFHQGQQGRRQGGLGCMLSSTDDVNAAAAAAGPFEAEVLKAAMASIQTLSEEELKKALNMCRVHRLTNGVYRQDIYGGGADRASAQSFLGRQPSNLSEYSQLGGTSSPTFSANGAPLSPVAAGVPIQAVCTIEGGAVTMKSIPGSLSPPSGSPLVAASYPQSSRFSSSPPGASSLLQTRTSLILSTHLGNGGGNSGGPGSGAASFLHSPEAPGSPVELDTTSISTFAAAGLVRASSGDPFGPRVSSGGGGISRSSYPFKNESLLALLLQNRGQSPGGSRKRLSVDATGVSSSSSAPGANVNANVNAWPAAAAAFIPSSFGGTPELTTSDSPTASGQAQATGQSPPSAAPLSDQHVRLMRLLSKGLGVSTAINGSGTAAASILPLSQRDSVASTPFSVTPTGPSLLVVGQQGAGALLSPGAASGLGSSLGTDSVATMWAAPVAPVLTSAPGGPLVTTILLQGGPSGGAVMLSRTATGLMPMAAGGSVASPSLSLTTLVPGFASQAGSAAERDACFLPCCSSDDDASDEDDEDSDSDTYCGVCLDVGDYCEIRLCGHQICVDCAAELLKLHRSKAALCPFCRTAIHGFAPVWGRSRRY